MNFRSFSAPLGGSVLAASLILTVNASAQGEDLGTLVNNAVVAMNAGKWEEGHQLLTQAVTRFGQNQPLTLHGAKFGTIYYNKGICEIKLKRWNDAMQSFETCYRDFPNKATDKGNKFHKMALLKWGEAAMGAENWELAISQFRKFLEERDKVQDRFPQGAFYVNMAICHYRLGRIPEGNENLEIAIKNKEHFPTPDGAIMAGFQALVTASIEKRNEQALLDFIGKNRGDLVLESYTMYRFSRLFMKLAGDAVSADMPRAAFALYQLVPSTDVALEDARAVVKALGPLGGLKIGNTVLDKQKLEKQIVDLEADLRGKQSPEMIRLAASAFLHEKNGNVRGAYAAYKQLETYYSNSGKREDNLYNLVRTSAIVAPGMETENYAKQFERQFPDSEYIQTIRRLRLSGLFYSGEYDACIEVASSTLPTLESGTPEHDLCLHVLSGSYFYTGKYDKAQPLLDEHVEKYPKSNFAVAAAYFQASNNLRLQYWDKASELLDAFLAAHPDPATNIYLPFALFDRATCHVVKEQPAAALEKLNRIIKEFPKSNIADQAYNLKGSVENSEGDAKAAEKDFIKALEIAAERNNRGVAGEALSSLVAMLANEPDRAKDAAAYADRFWKDYADGSPFQAQVAVAQVPALEAVGRGDEALKRLQSVISTLAKNPEAAGLEKLINSYTEIYLASHTAEELKDHYYEFPGIRSSDRAARALLRVAVIGVFEGVAKKAQDENQKRSAEAMIKILFQQLKTDFDLKDLTNFILKEVGDYLRQNTSTPREALPYYDEILSREDQSYRFAALLGRADVYGKSGNPADIDKALEDFSRILTDSKDRNEKDFALFRTIELLMAKGDYDKAAEQAKAYLDRKSGYNKYSPQVGLMLAQSFEFRKMINDAIAMYVKVWSAHLGYIEISAPAMKSWMSLSWARNNPSTAPGTPADRQGAYQAGAKYIMDTERLKDKMSESDLALWQEVEKLVKTYEADANIKSMEEIKREKEAARR